MRFVEITASEFLRDVVISLLKHRLPHLSGLPLFYKKVLNARQRIVAHTPLSKNEVENEVIWNNNLLQLQESRYFIDRVTCMKPELNTLKI